MTALKMYVWNCSAHNYLKCKELVSKHGSGYSKLLSSLPASIAKVGKTSLIMSLVSEEFPEVVWRKLFTSMMPLHVNLNEYLAVWILF